MRKDWIQRARQWLESRQNDDGGWGESCASYIDPAAQGRGESTASQTAWAVMGLCTFPGVRSASVNRGVAYLLDRQSIFASCLKRLKS
jgi:squalene-hopene/tetraprenyl-beta-curcumene cyclase